MGITFAWELTGCIQKVVAAARRGRHMVTALASGDQAKIGLPTNTSNRRREKLLKCTVLLLIVCGGDLESVPRCQHC